MLAVAAESVLFPADNGGYVRKHKAVKQTAPYGEEVI